METSIAEKAVPKTLIDQSFVGEIGHSALAEHVIAQVAPSEEEFPYMIRIVSEVLESNGSSSQAGICAGILAMMDAGDPIKAPVAGIAMGVVMDGDDYTILTDIKGLEDHLDDKEALAQANKARMEILATITATIAEPRAELSKYAPKIEMIQIKPEKIKDAIGKGGDTINGIIDETGVKN